MPGKLSDNEHGLNLADGSVRRVFICPIQGMNE